MLTVWCLLVFIVFSLKTLVIAEPESKTPSEPSSNGQHEIYRKHSLCGPFLDVLPKKKAEKLRSILDQEDTTKREIDKAVVQWINKQDEEIQEQYSSFKRALKRRLLRLKLKHEMKVKDFSEEAKKLDEDIQNLIEDQDLTWVQTCKKKNELIRKASKKALKELGIRIEKCEEKRPESESGESVEGSNEEQQNPMDYTNHHGGFDYQSGGHGFDYESRDSDHRKTKSGRGKQSDRESKGKSRGHEGGNFDYRNQEYDEDH
ncbi:hypothetical protein M3Y96_01065700 [Aphelenchoides besseyi]|nr:hypothetical protein M3Y96_01065700 [Aphelenchoides besseyi]